MEVDERTPPLLVHQGEGFRMQKFPLGTRVVYPPDALPGIRDVGAAVQHALLHPVGDSKPLTELLFPGHEAHDRDRRHLDPAAADAHARRAAADPGARDRARRARKGVEDLELIIATALHRRMTAPRSAGRWASACSARSGPTHLYNFDAEDPQALLEIGTDRPRTSWSRSPSAPPSRDLIVYVNINLVAMDGGHKSVAVGLAGYRSLKHHHNVNTMLHSKSYMDPREGHSAINDSVNRMGRVLADSGRQDLPDRDHRSTPRRSRRTWAS